MAEADKRMSNVDELDGPPAGDHAVQADAFMPHLLWQGEKLDKEFPSIVPPEEEDLDDLVDDARDGIYQKGIQIARSILAGTSIQ